MRYNFVKFGATASLNLDEKGKDYLFFDQNREKFRELFDFLSGEKSCFVLAGFQGTGKSKLLEQAISFLDSEVLLFKYQLFEATTIDDLLLNLTIDFREYHKMNKTILPKIDTKDFREKIQSYVKNIDKPMLLILEGYESILKNEDIAQEINDFLLHLASLNKFKIIFVSRVFNTELLEKQDISYTKTILTSLNEDLVKEYIERHGLEVTNEAVQKLVSASRCYLKYIDMTIKLLQTFNISLNDLMFEFEAKKTTYSNFLINKFMSLVPAHSRELVYLLAIIRQSVSKEFLKLVGQTNENAVNYLQNILILNEDRGNLFVKDYFKKEIEKEIDQFSKIKIHSFLEQFYYNMLPKKPFERELMISRNTMRREQEYHLAFVENYQKAGMRADPNMTTLRLKTQRPESSQESSTQQIETTQELETPMLDSITKDIPTVKPVPEIHPNNSFSDYVKHAEKYEGSFDYTTAIFYYQKALEKNQDPAFELKRPQILTKIAKCYLKTHEHESAIRYFTIAYEIYSAQKQFTEANKALLEIAQEHKNSYKLSSAKKCIEKILNASLANTPEILARAYNILADIEDLSSNVITARDLYKKALDNALLTNNKYLISKAYFKYGLLLDDTNQQTAAIECYKKCILTSTDVNINTNLSSAYSNLAGIFYEREDVKKALKYYNEALKTDTQTQNNEGLYFVNTKLALIYEHSNKELTYKYLLEALQAAKRADDKIYLAEAYFEIGNYYYKNNEYIQATKAYINSQKIFGQDGTPENRAKINLRLKELQIRLSPEVYETLVKESIDNAD